jgi:hypothetical protein
MNHEYDVNDCNQGFTYLEMFGVVAGVNARGLWQPFEEDPFT